jgi:High potential iron-sulfur protein
MILPDMSKAEAPLRPVDPEDPGAKALGFVTRTQKVNARAYPFYKPSQKCGTCERFQGKETDAIAGCDIFAGHSVPRDGWCKAWVGKH